MIVRSLAMFLTVVTLASAELLITPDDALKAAFGQRCVVEKHVKLLGKVEASAVTARAGNSLNSKIIRYYTAAVDAKPVATGILLTRKVRTKSAIVLYVFTPDTRLHNAEIIAFQEPLEYIPAHEWMTQFADTNTSRPFRVGKDISVITGATLSARAIADGARIAGAIYAEVFAP